jgi:polar amino acid transport system substrate-binding protein
LAVAVAAGLLFLPALSWAAPKSAPHDSAQARPLRWGADREGGGPYVYPDPKQPDRYVGFEVGLANALGHVLARKPQFVPRAWDQILAELDRGTIDIGLNGYEYTAQRARHYRASIPYYVYELGLCVRADRAATLSWASLRAAPSNGRKLRIGVLGGSSADRFVTAEYDATCKISRYEGVAETFLLVGSGQLDATVQDLPALQFFLRTLDRYPNLKIVGEPVQPGYYVAYARWQDGALIQEIDSAIRQLYDDGTLRRIYEKYGLWNAAQERLPEIWKHWPPPDDSSEAGIMEQVRAEVPLFFRAAGVTVLLASLSMPIAVAIGLAAALIRAWPARILGGDGRTTTVAGKLVRGVTTTYIEIIRGTPLAFQLFVIYFVLPDLGVTISEFWAGVIALAVNYSAYEAEIMRLGIQSVPLGQMEAALSLGMSRSLAVRRIILPQAIRTVIPATANDFIALFKDTAVCSVIAVEELSKQYSVAAKSTGLYLQMAVLASLLYLAMSYPLSLLAAWLERRLKRETMSD